ncbi:heterokaryon incompatibility protein-domain-containing protein, partial [Massariosphaeria phaeospora]
MQIDGSPYSYRPLDSVSAIRILALHPAQDFLEPLEADLLHADREQMLLLQGYPKRYDAVSYCWGEATFSQQISCQGYPIRITYRVDTMLRHLRKKARERVLWIDAICLDQLNAEEKAVQVALMGDIYRQARTVHVWLGDASDEHCIPDIFALFRAMAVRKDRLAFQKASLDAGTHATKVDMSTLIADHALSSFLARPWFQRRWVLQEVVLGNNVKVRCGRFKIPWSWLAEGTSALVSGSDSNRVLEQHGDAIFHVLALHERKDHLLDLLGKFHAAQCSDPRDRLYALF